jgi:hypothetical protein
VPFTAKYLLICVHIFAEINPNCISDQVCVGLFHRLVMTVSGADDSRPAEATKFYVVRQMTGSDQRYERDKTENLIEWNT